MSLQPSFEAQARENSDFTDNTYKRMMNVTYKEIVQSISIPMLPDVECCSLFRTPEQSSGVSCPLLRFICTACMIPWTYGYRFQIDIS